MEIVAQNGAEQVRYRHYKNILDISGKGVMIFCAWSVIRTVAYFIMDPIDTEQYSLGTTGKIILYVLLAIILGIDVLLRIIVGLGAQKASHGKKKGVGYIIVAFFLLLLSIFSVVTFFMSTFDLLHAATIIGSIIAEIISGIILVELIVSAIIIRHQGR